LVYPETREIVVYSSTRDSGRLHVGDVVDGGAVLAGFSAPVAEIFAELDDITE
jgi:hypothetical protein